MLFFFLIISASLIAGIWWFKYRQKRQLIENYNVVRVEGAIERYPNLPLRDYGLSVRIRDFDRVNIVFPRLNSEGDVEYIYSWHALSDVRMPEGDQANSLQPELVQELFALIREHLRIEGEISQLQKQYDELQDLADLVGSSSLYADYADTYNRAAHQSRKLLKQAEELGGLYIRSVREGLIGVQVSEYDLASWQGDIQHLDRQCQKLRYEFETLRDTTASYAELIREGRRLNADAS